MFNWLARLFRRKPKGNAIRYRKEKVYARSPSSHHTQLVRSGANLNQVPPYRRPEPPVSEPYLPSVTTESYSSGGGGEFVGGGASGSWRPSSDSGSSSSYDSGGSSDSGSSSSSD